MGTEYRALCGGCKVSFPTRFARCPYCTDRAAIPLSVVAVTRVAFTRDVPVGVAS